MYEASGRENSAPASTREVYTNLSTGKFGLNFYLFVTARWRKFPALCLLVQPQPRLLFQPGGER